MKRYLSLIALFALVLTSLTAPAIATEISTQLTFQTPTVEMVDGYNRVMLQGTRNINDAGAPTLPSMGIWMLLPPGDKAVSYSLNGEKWEKLDGKYNIEPTPTPHPLSLPNPPETVPDQNIYNSKVPYPASPTSGLATHLKRGYALSTCLVWPVRWNPADGSLEYLTNAELVIQTEPGNRETEAFNRFFKGDRRTERWVTDQVRNPNELSLYPRRDNDSPEKMLIVTVDGYSDLAEEYANWHTLRGLVTEVASCEQYIDDEEGVDDPACIRNGIIRAYEEDDFTFLLLIGDDEDVPHRGLYATVNDAPDIDIPADIYFAGFDGTWNDDDDDRFAEGGEADILTEVFVGRICASDANEVERSMNKVMLYSDEPVVGNVLDILMVGEELSWANMGGDYMDEVYDPCDRYNYETSGIPERFQRTNLYDRDAVWSAVNDLAPLMSDGNHFVHHLGHANTRYNMKFNAGDLNDDLLTNNGVDNGFNIVWTQGCYCGAFDNRTTEVGNYTNDCITEVFTHKLDNGPVAFISNSRYGWGSGGNTDGASQHFHREFVDAMFDENITRIGATNQDSKEDVAPWMDSGVMRWCYWEINLFGDPAMDMWTDEPEEVDANFDNAIIIGDEVYEVQVNQAPANVILSRDGEPLYIAVTDENGTATFDITEPISPPGDVTLTIIAHDCLPFNTTIQSIPSDIGYPWIEDIMLLDIDGGGIEDGLADHGETIELSPSVRNLGRETLEGLTATLTIDDPFVNIIQQQVRFELIEQENEILSTDVLIVEIGDNCPDLHQVNMELLMEDENGNSWTQALSFETHAPVMNDYRITILEDGGNENGHFDPGEDVDFALTLVNSGTGAASNVTIEFATDNPMVEVITGSAEIELIQPTSTVDVNTFFRVSISEEMPDPYRMVLYLRLNGDRGMQRTLLIDQPVGGIYNDFDRNQEMWAHGVVEDNEDYVDQWHMTDEDNYTYDGSGCVKVGGGEGEEYSGMLNCEMYLPDIFLEAPTELMFWHKIDAEDSNNHPDSCYDGGFLEISVDDGFWRNLYPVCEERNYPYVIIHGNAENPLEEFQPCYSGEQDWELALFDLSAYEGYDVQIRFRFGSDAAVNRGGWWIDDVELRMKVEMQYPDNLEGEITDIGIQLTWDTPLIPQRDEDVIPNELLGYRIYSDGGTGNWEMLELLITDNRYFDDLIGQQFGRYGYMVTAEYRTGESEASNMLFIDWATSVESDDHALPDKWAITSTYPNPFNSTTRIGYSVPVVGHVEIGVFDLQGRLVQQLENSIRQPGYYNVGFDGGSLPSGLYFVRMQTIDGFSGARLLLLK